MRKTVINSVKKSITLSIDQSRWLEALAQERQWPVSLIVREAINLYRLALDQEAATVESDTGLSTCPRV